MTRTTPTLAALAAVALGLCACTEDTKQDKTTITLGGLLDTTGALSEIGSEEIKAVDLAVALVNDSGGVLDSELAFDNRDPALDPGRATQAATALVNAGVGAIVGSTASGITLAAAEVTVPGGVVLISGASTSPSITGYADNGLLWRTISSDALQGRVLAARARAKNFTRAATIYVPGAYGQGLSDTFETAFEAAGGTVTSANAYTEDQQSYAALLATVMADDPDAVVLIGYPVDAAQIVKDYLAAHAASGTFWFFTDGISGAEFITGVGASAFNGFSHEGTLPATPAGAEVDAFKAAFSARYGRPVNAGFTGAINVYDAVLVLALAMQAAGAADGASIKSKLAAVSTPPGTTYGPSQFAQALAAVKAGTEIDFQGASGQLDFDAAGDVGGTYDIWDVQNGALHTVASGLSP